MISNHLGWLNWLIAVMVTFGLASQPTSATAESNKDSDTKQEEAELLKTAQAALEKGEYLSGYQTLEEVLDLNSDSTKAKQLKKQYTKAISHAYYESAYAAFQLTDYKNAKKNIKQALKLNENHADAYALRGAVKFKETVSSSKIDKYIDQILKDDEENLWISQYAKLASDKFVEDAAFSLASSTYTFTKEAGLKKVKLSLKKFNKNLASSKKDWDKASELKSDLVKSPELLSMSNSINGYKHLFDTLHNLYDVKDDSIDAMQASVKYAEKALKADADGKSVRTMYYSVRTTKNFEKLEELTAEREELVPQLEQAYVQALGSTAESVVESNELNSGDTSDIDWTLNGYAHSLIEAINTGDFSLVEPFLQPGSDIYNMQEELVDDLYNRGISETLHHFEIIDITQTAPQTYTVHTTEQQGIIKNGEEKIKSFQWIYTVQEENGQILLTNMIQK